MMASSPILYYTRYSTLAQNIAAGSDRPFLPQKVLFRQTQLSQDYDPKQLLRQVLSEKSLLKRRSLRKHKLKHLLLKDEIMVVSF